MAILSLVRSVNSFTFWPNDDDTLIDVFLLLVLLAGLWFLKLFASVDASEWLRSALSVAYTGAVAAGCAVVVLKAIHRNREHR